MDLAVAGPIISFEKNLDRIIEECATVVLSFLERQGLFKYIFDLEVGSSPWVQYRVSQPWHY